ncbi:unnamed protein product [Adineta ricciae]|uniref:UBC core domain-containing protein n=1 Tax=Adineta ricciae TaxID=249248 RepID=A0A815PS45_ADIRI|nr:unnamed protein product [Adineta ricciae]
MSSVLEYKQLRALVIGINKYPNDPLTYCVNDAEDLRDALEDIGFRVSCTIDCSFTKLYSEIDTFTSTLQPNDLAMFYFAGHGKQYKDENYMLPADYSCGHSQYEDDHIKNSAVNINYITNKPAIKKCAATIYLLDCCRRRIKPASSSGKESLAKMDGLRQSLVVFGCSPGGAVQDETRNGRNGSFMENLLKNIKRPNTDIEEIIKDVAHSVSLQTSGFQVPHRTSSIVGKVFLVKEDHQCTKKLIPIGNSNNVFSFTNKRSDDHVDTVSDDENVFPDKQKKRKSGKSNKNVPLSTVNCPKRSSSDRQDGSTRRDQQQTNISSEPIDYDKLSDSDDEKSPQIKTTTTSQTPTVRKPIRQTPRNNSREPTWVKKIYMKPNSDEDISNSDTDGLEPPRKSFIKSRNLPKPPSAPAPTTSIPDGFATDRQSPINEQPSRTTVNQARDETGNPSPIVTSTHPPVVRIRTLYETYSIPICDDVLMKDFINTIWNKIKFDKEKYFQKEHILLFFNHRLHIFADSDPNALVKDFLALSPPANSDPSEAIDFYVYGLPQGYAEFMYQVDDDIVSIFRNSDSWCSFHYAEYKQLERAQSVFLSSLFALRLYFRPEVPELKARQLVMEAEFFRELRKYLFPPAILALKHAIDGFMFRFEKILLMDALIQLLMRLCDPNKIFLEEICDFIPLLICWLLHKCDPTSTMEEYFLNVALINDQKEPSCYFQNPVTTSKSNRQVLLLEEFQDVKNCTELKHHADIRSLTLYLSSLGENSSNPRGQCNVYIIYDPKEQDPSNSHSLQVWTDAEIENLYILMAQTNDYHSFSIITRGFVTDHTRNQLVLLEKNRTVALLISSKNILRSSGETSRNVDHFFEIFDPLQCTKERPYLEVKPEVFVDEKQQLPDPRLPGYLSNGLDITMTCAHELSDNTATVPAYQATMILLDQSRSMSDYRVVSDDPTKNCSHIDICKIMLGRLSDNILSTNEVYAFGLIAFGEHYKTICRLTRAREEFDRALSSDQCDASWTCMYDAIGEAIRQIAAFTSSPIRARKDCKRLIICLSDGIDNRSKTTINDLKGLVKKHNVAIDLISFVHDKQLKNPQEVEKATQIRKLCAESGGYVYNNLRTRSNIELASMFEQEAAVWLSKRSKSKSGTVDKPERYVPLAFEQRASQQVSSNDTISKSSCLRLIMREFISIKTRPIKNVMIFAVDNNIAFWKVILKGPPKTPYEDRFWMLYVEFNDKYPNCPPNVRFFTPIFHVNINADGKICHQILNRNWCVRTTMSTVFENILDLLKKPNFEDGLVLEMTHLYKENANEYEKQAKFHADRYAASDVETLKKQHKLQDDN